MSCGITGSVKRKKGRQHYGHMFGCASLFFACTSVIRVCVCVAHFFPSFDFVGPFFPQWMLDIAEAQPPPHSLPHTRKMRWKHDTPTKKKREEPPLLGHSVALVPTQRVRRISSLLASSSLARTTPFNPLFSEGKAQHTTVHLATTASTNGAHAAPVVVGSLPVKHTR